MANININPNAPQYQARLADLIAVLQFMRPRLRHFHALDEEQQERWLSHDPILRRFKRIAERWQDGVRAEDESDGD